MKIQQIKPVKQGQGINILYQIKEKKFNKFFKWNQFNEASDFAVSIFDDRYIDSCPLELLDWMKQNNHPIIQKKYWDFC